MEIEALQAIFCQPNEFELLSHQEGGETILAVNLHSSDTEGKIRLVFTLPISYPEVVPHIHVSSSHLSRHTSAELQNELEKESEAMRGQEMLMDLILWTKENFKKYLDKDEKIMDKEASMTAMGSQMERKYSILRLDHMRSRTKYIKLLEKWANNLQILGGVFFVGQIILVLIIGKEENIRKFLVRLKTESVDVDSKGRKCKEKMLKILGNGDAKHFSGSTFDMKEFKIMDELHNYFLENKIDDIFTLHVSDLHGAT